MSFSWTEDRRIAYECDTFKKMVEKEGFKEGQTNEIQLPTITGKLLEKVIEYLYFKYKYTDAKACYMCSDWIMQNVYNFLARLSPGLANTVLEYKLAHREDFWRDGTTP
eukprot:Skav200455  [mRNA]  locus=scaffold4319:8387:10253:+ [translate_table: standard]